MRQRGKNRFVCGICIGLFLVCFSMVGQAELSVEQAWNNEYEELSSQIIRMGKKNDRRRERLNKEALDLQALILPDDTDPLSVVFRRTVALVKFYIQQDQLSKTTLNTFKKKLNAMAAAEKRAMEPAARRELFTRVCALRREMIFVNPQTRHH